MRVLSKGQSYTELPKYIMWKGKGEGPYCHYVVNCMIDEREKGHYRYASSSKYLSLKIYNNNTLASTFVNRQNTSLHHAEEYY